MSINYDGLGTAIPSPQQRVARPARMPAGRHRQGHKIINPKIIQTKMQLLEVLPGNEIKFERKCLP